MITIRCRVWACMHMLDLLLWAISGFNSGWLWYFGVCVWVVQVVGREWFRPVVADLFTSYYTYCTCHVWQIKRLVFVGLFIVSCGMPCLSRDGACSWVSNEAEGHVLIAQIENDD